MVREPPLNFLLEATCNWCGWLVVFEAPDGDVVVAPIDVVGKAAGESCIVGLNVVVRVSVEGSWNGRSSGNSGGKSSLGIADGRSSKIAGVRSALNAGSPMSSSFRISGELMGRHGLLAN
jgi:hypothetical protein